MQVNVSAAMRQTESYTTSKPKHVANARKALISTRTLTNVQNPTALTLNLITLAQSASSVILQLSSTTILANASVKKGTSTTWTLKFVTKT